MYLTVFSFWLKLDYHAEQVNIITHVYVVLNLPNILGMSFCIKKCSVCQLIINIKYFSPP